MFFLLFGEKESQTFFLFFSGFSAENIITLPRIPPVPSFHFIFFPLLFFSESRWSGDLMGRMSRDQHQKEDISFIFRIFLFNYLFKFLFYDWILEMSMDCEHWSLINPDLMVEIE